eukprot:373289_1
MKTDIEKYNLRIESQKKNIKFERKHVAEKQLKWKRIETLTTNKKHDVKVRRMPLQIKEQKRNQNVLDNAEMTNPKYEHHAEYVHKDLQSEHDAEYRNRMKCGQEEMTDEYDSEN